jgi:hypothetical protein
MGMHFEHPGERRDKTGFSSEATHSWPLSPVWGRQPLRAPQPPPPPYTPSLAGAMRCFATDHSLAVRAIADAKDAFRASVATGACPALERVSLGFGLAEVQLYSRPGM